jgi:hypothetical protein
MRDMMMSQGTVKRFSNINSARPIYAGATWRQYSVLSLVRFVTTEKNSGTDSEFIDVHFPS